MRTMVDFNLNQKIRIRNKIFTIKELISALPNRYEYKQYLDNSTSIQPNVIYKFCFNKESIIKSNAKIILKGKIFHHDITIFHSAKLFKFFDSQELFMLAGIIDSGTCFYPEILKSIKTIDELIPIYGINSNFVPKYISKYINELPFVIKDIFSKIHLPETIEDVKNGLSQLLCYELSIFINNLKSFKKNKIPYEIKEVKSPFILTDEQEIAWKEIQEDLQDSFRSIRLIHGDVGSGKTLLAFLSAMTVAQNNKQVVIMAPTSLLSEQIYEFFNNNNYLNFKIDLIQASTKKKDKLSDRSLTNIFIGTHALLYKDYLTNVGLVIIDEQHKFGVLQRNQLMENSSADVIMLSATPIPRTFKMISQGYLKYSVLKKTHIGGIRKTIVASSEKINEVIEKMKDISLTNKVIWVCKTIELAEERFEQFKLFNDNCFLLHSKIKEKNEYLEKFDSLESAILISTTVIEVGIDIDVSYIFIENADSFGLSQLHQMRGRIARRKNRNGYCILIGSNLSKLNQIKKSDDGFAITELDSSRRGGGIIHGTQQSGLSSFNFAKGIENNKIVNIEITEEIINKAKNIETPKEFLDFFDNLYTEEIIS